MESVELLKQAAFQRGFEKQSFAILGKAKGLGSKLWQMAKGKPSPLFEPVFDPSKIVRSAVATTAPKFNSKELARLEKWIRAMNAKPVTMAPELTSKELARLDKLITSMNKAKAPLAPSSVRDFSTRSSLRPIGFTMGGPKIF